MKLDELKELEAKALPSPWYYVSHNWHEGSVYSDKTGQRVLYMDTEDWGVDEENQDKMEALQANTARFIAASRTALPQAIALIERLAGALNRINNNAVIYNKSTEEYSVAPYAMSALTEALAALQAFKDDVTGGGDNG